MALTLAAVPRPSALFREDQRFTWWVYAALAVMMGLQWALLTGHGPGLHAGAVGPHSPVATGLGLVAGVGLPILLLVGVLRMTTVVTPGEVRIWFGWLPTYRRLVPINSIQRIEVVRYRPIRDYGGWGIRVGRDGEKALNARGDLGVRLHLAGGGKLLIGSQHPEDLARAIDAQLHPA